MFWVFFFSFNAIKLLEPEIYVMSQTTFWVDELSKNVTIIISFFSPFCQSEKTLKNGVFSQLLPWLAVFFICLHAVAGWPHLVEVEGGLEALQFHNGGLRPGLGGVLRVPLVAALQSCERGIT